MGDGAGVGSGSATVTGGDGVGDSADVETSVAEDAKAKPGGETNNIQVVSKLVSRLKELQGLIAEKQLQYNESTEKLGRTKQDLQNISSQKQALRNQFRALALQIESQRKSVLAAIDGGEEERKDSITLEGEDFTINFY